MGGRCLPLRVYVVNCEYEQPPNLSCGCMAEMIFIIIVRYVDNNIIRQRMIQVPDNDIEYYERKVVRMEQDIGILQDELNRVRLKLRSAEDYEIKYRILIKNNQVDLQRVKIEIAKTEEIKYREMIAQALKQNDERWTRVKDNLQEELRKQADAKLEQISQQLEAAKKKIKEISQKKEQMELFSFKIRKFEKENAALQLQLSDIKRECEKQKNEELASLRNQLNSSFRERLAAERQAHEVRISSLTKKLTEDQIEDKIELLLPDISNAELVALKDLYAATKTSHEKEISEFQERILRKNTQIKSLLRQQTEREVKFQDILTNKNKELSKLEEQVTRLRKQNQQQALQLGQRFTNVKNSQTEVLKEQLRAMAQLCKEKENELSRLAQAHAEQFQLYQQRAKEDISREVEQKNRYQKAFNDLLQKLKEKQEEIIQLNSQIGFDKSKSSSHPNGEEAGQYQNGILFLEKQLRRSQHKLQEKNRQIAKIDSDFQTYRKETETELARLHELLKSQQKASDEKLNTQGNQIRDLVEKIVIKSKEIAHEKKSFLSEKHSLQARIRQLERQLGELQQDYNRLQGTRKQLQGRLRAEREKDSYQPASISNYSKELKGQLENIYREKEEYLLTKHDEKNRILRDQINNHNQKLRNLELENISLKKTNQRLSNELQYNKQNSKVDRQRKIATIDLELARLGNIYQSFLQSKSRSDQPLQNRLGLSRRQQDVFRTPSTSK